MTWDVQLKDEQVQIDPLMAQQALLELFANAFQHERNVKMITVKAYIAPPKPTASPARTSGAAGNGRFVFELHEPKARFELSTENWGREPLRHLGQGHYGLGLNRTRMIIETHGGDFTAQYDRAIDTDGEDILGRFQRGIFAFMRDIRSEPAKAGGDRLFGFGMQADFARQRQEAQRGVEIDISRFEAAR